jgi:acetyl-CoA C-acetyltransferase
VSTVNVSSQFMARVLSEAALQVVGRAGAHQVHGARTALGHAYRGGSQFFSIWVVSGTPR